MNSGRYYPVRVIARFDPARGKLAVTFEPPGQQPHPQPDDGRPLWHRAIAGAGEDVPADLRQAVRDELECLWTDLAEARRNALNGQWSVGCDNLAERIISLSRLAGATPWENVEIPLLLDGIYQGILTDAGIEHTEPGPDDLPRMQAWRDSQKAKARR